MVIIIYAHRLCSILDEDVDSNFISLALGGGGVNILSLCLYDTKW